MVQQGWIKIHRQIYDCALWNTTEAYDKRSAWIDLILTANYEDKEIFFNNSLLLVKRGSFITSELKLSERWKWSRHKVSDFLKLLKNTKMIECFKDNKKTTVTILNYTVYQSLECEKDIERTTEGQQKDTDKNIKNIKNIFLSESIEFRLADFLRKWIVKNNPDAKVPDDAKLNNWCKDIDLMIRIDKRNPDDIKKIIEFSQKDSFWHMNIRSTSKLREQYDQLDIKMKNNKSLGTMLPEDNSEYIR